VLRSYTSARTRIAEHRVWEKARRRVQRLPDPELLLWWESTLYGLQRTREAYEKSRDTAALTEAAQGVAALQAVVDELAGRAEH
jgi:hypothetical protein